MKIIRKANKQTIKISKKEWENIGKKTGWMKKAQFSPIEEIKGIPDIAEAGRIEIEQLAKLSNAVKNGEISMEAALDELPEHLHERFKKLI